MRVDTRVVACFGIVLLAGCSLGLGATGPAVPATTQDCLTDNVPSPGDLESLPGAGSNTASTPTQDLDPRSYPASPSQGNTTELGTFAVEFEEAYRTNRFLHRWQDNRSVVSSYSVQMEYADVSQESDWVKIELDGGHSVQYDPGGVGMSRGTVTYYLNETTIWRSQGAYSDISPPKNATLLVHCST